MALEITDGNIAETLKNNEITVIDFWAPWCGPCRILGPVIDELATENVDIAIGKVNIDENSNMASEYGIRGIPTIIFFKDGEVAGKIVGMKNKTELQAKIDELKNK